MAWHGKNHENLESIIKYGLKLPKSKLENGKITSQPRVIPEKEEVDGIKNWEKAIFVSPSVFGASKYSSSIMNYFEQYRGYYVLYLCLIEVMIKPNSYTIHERKHLTEIMFVFLFKYRRV